MGKGEGDQGPGERGLGWREGRGDEGGSGWREGPKCGGRSCQRYQIKRNFTYSPFFCEMSVSFCFVHVDPLFFFFFGRLLRVHMNFFTVPG